MLRYTKINKNIYLVKEESTRVNVLNSILIEKDDDNNSVLIDANYSFSHIDELYARIKHPVLALILSHFHTDHTAHAFYHEKKYEAPLFGPIQEKEYFLSLDSIMENVGFSKLGARVKENYLFFANEYMKYQECKEIHTFKPDFDTLEFSSVKLETIHIPGHSPGHTAFIITSKNNGNKDKILYASDIGSHPYYGDFISDLKDYKESINKLEEIYLSDNFLLIPSHGTIYLEKDKDFFNRIRSRIKKNELKVLKSLSKTQPKSIKELVEERIITPEARIYPEIKYLYYLWDGGTIFQHIKEFADRGIVEKVEEIDFLNDKYILI